MKLGSLFDGSGTCPLAAQLCGIEPVWASEVDPYCIRVTKKNLPGMKHLGSVLDVNGAEVEPVDIITFGSPCQDLSVGGAQAGLEGGERSSLFFEAIRIIREMRDATHGRYPRFILFENVPGLFTSCGGRDFKTVIEQMLRISDPYVSVPEPERIGNRLAWDKAGAVLGEGFSLAWRTLDSQYWGVPQRRKRIIVIGDLRGTRAGEVLFKQEGLRGDIKEMLREREASAGCTGEGT